MRRRNYINKHNLTRFLFTDVSRAQIATYKYFFTNCRTISKRFNALLIVLQQCDFIYLTEIDNTFQFWYIYKNNFIILK
ncbi:Protein of unknown function [Gryllus bimaculatus]|nr:Protein of unknown function [Gryllus bimaculatus]